MDTTKTMRQLCADEPNLLRSFGCPFGVLSGTEELFVFVAAEQQAVYSIHPQADLLFI